MCDILADGTVAPQTAQLTKDGKIILMPTVIDGLEPANTTITATVNFFDVPGTFPPISFRAKPGQTINLADVIDTAKFAGTVTVVDDSVAVRVEAARADFAQQFEKAKPALEAIRGVEEKARQVGVDAQAAAQARQGAESAQEEATEQAAAARESASQAQEYSRAAQAAKTAVEESNQKVERSNAELKALVQEKGGVPGPEGHSPVLAWEGDRISIDGKTGGPHLTGLQGEKPVVGLSDDFRLTVDGQPVGESLRGPKGDTGDASAALAGISINGDRTAIGTGATATAEGSTAIGAGATTENASEIVLGTPSDTVRIPGKITSPALAEAVRETVAGLKDELRGEPGAEGPRGPEGDRGPAGSDGKEGPVGPMGPAGPPGEPGETGPAGADGKQGPAGPPGKQGETGPRGPAGPPGKQGETGPRGPAGRQGETGPRGPKGDAGTVINARTGKPFKVWVGTKEDLISQAGDSMDSETAYFIEGKA
ncbi:hypothetical protein [Arcanobacterium canis]